MLGIHDFVGVAPRDRGCCCACASASALRKIVKRLSHHFELLAKCIVDQAYWAFFSLFSSLHLLGAWALLPGSSCDGLSVACSTSQTFVEMCFTFPFSQEKNAINHISKRCSHDMTAGLAANSVFL